MGGARAYNNTNNNPTGDDRSTRPHHSMVVPAHRPDEFLAAYYRAGERGRTNGIGAIHPTGKKRSSCRWPKARLDVVRRAARASRQRAPARGPRPIIPGAPHPPPPLPASQINCWNKQPGGHHHHHHQQLAELGLDQASAGAAAAGSGAAISGVSSRHNNSSCRRAPPLWTTGSSSPPSRWSPHAASSSSGGCGGGALLSTSLMNDEKKGLR